MRVKSVLLCLVLSVFIIILSCGGSDAENIEIVNISGVDRCFLHTQAFGKYNAVVPKTGKITSAVTNGEFLQLTVGNNFFYYIYNIKDGRDLKFAFDGVKVKLNNKIISVETTPAGLSWIKNVDEKELKTLRMLYILDDLTSDVKSILGSLAAINEDVGLILESNKFLSEVSSLFNPRFLFLQDKVSGTELNALEKFSNLEFLWINLKNATDISFLAYFDSLYQLVLQEWDATETGEIDKKLRGLKKLYLIDSDLDGLLPVSKLVNLEELGCSNSISNLKGIDRLKKLKRFSMPGLDPNIDFSFFKDMKNLCWAVVPEDVTQDKFNLIVDAIPETEVLEIYGVEKIPDLSALKSLKKLKSLTIINSSSNVDIDYSSLHKLKKLRVFNISEEQFSADSKELEELEGKLPECLVVPSGICLGSGWILFLIFVPLLAFIILFIKNKKRRG